MNALARLVADFRAEFAANARLRLGLWVVAAVLLFYLALLQADRVTTAYADYAAEAERLARSQALLEREDWPQLLQAERAANQALAKSFWQADTQGLAQARVQAELADIADRLELRDVRIQPGLTQPVPEAPGLWRVQAQFSAAYDPGAQLKVLHALAIHPKKLTVERIDLHQASPRLLLILSAYFMGFDVEPETD